MLAALSFAAAQITLSPTDTGVDDVSSGGDSASVDQTVTLEIPKATALHLTASEIAFDFSANTPADYNCVYVNGADETLDLATNWYSQTQVIPGGIAYAASSLDTDGLKLVYADETDVLDSELVSSYPPIELVGDSVDNESKRYFVCYQTFVMQLFANYDGWQLLVDRAALTPTGAQEIEHLYIQANTCANLGAGTGLYDLPAPADSTSTTQRNLIPDNLNNASTGALVTQSATSGTNVCRQNTSWLDVLGVLAVKVNADKFGTNTADLAYSLVSPDWIADTNNNYQF